MPSWLEGAFFKGWNFSDIVVVDIPQDRGGGCAEVELHRAVVVGDITVRFRREDADGLRFGENAATVAAAERNGMEDRSKELFMAERRRSEPCLCA